MPTEIEFQKQVGFAIRQQRKAAAISLRDLETTIGIARGNLSNFENGKTNLTLSTIYKLAAAFRCSPKDFFL